MVVAEPLPGMRDHMAVEGGCGVERTGPSTEYTTLSDESTARTRKS